MSNWTDQFVGDRMTVDREFNEQVRASEFSSQEWGTIMTAVELEIENAEDPETARLVADTSKVDQVMPALEEMQGGMGGMGGPGAGGGNGGDGGGFLSSVKDSLGLGGDTSDERAETAVALADEYAQQFQEHLESKGKWERACRVAASDADDSFDAGGSTREGGSDTE